MNRKLTEEELEQVNGGLELEDSLRTGLDVKLQGKLEPEGAKLQGNAGPGRADSSNILASAGPR